MKKRYLFSFLIMFAIAFAMAFVGFTNLNNSKVAEAAKQDPAPPVVENTIYDFVGFSQDGYVFSENDFEMQEVAGVKYYYLYTNKTISIFHKNAIPTNENFSVEINTTGTSYEPILDADSRVRVYDGTKYFIFDNANQTEDKVTKLNIRYTQQHPGDKYNPTGYTTYHSLKLNLVQTANNFPTPGEISWTYNNGKKELTAPTNGYEYSPLTLNIPNGSNLNPITVKFEYCGEVYEIYNINGQYYNYIGKDSGNNLLTFTKLEFSVSGIYKVEIYDKTHASGYPNANYLSYKFTIENENASNKFAQLYIHASNEDGEQVMNQQISNSKTVVKFENITIKKIRDNIDYITVKKSYRPTGGENVSETIRYGGNQLPTELTFDSDGSYNIDIYSKDDDSKPIKHFEFILLDSIRTLFEVDGIKYEVKETDPDYIENETKTQYIDRTVSSSYNNGMIYGETTYTFKLMIAKSVPTINGVEDNARTSDTVNITVNGVGNIDVTITQDGKTYTKVAKNNESIASFSAPGKYFIKITDEMGTTVTKSFTITLKMNTAAIALIVIAAIVIVVMLVVVIVSRTKVKVR